MGGGCRGGEATGGEAGEGGGGRGCGGGGVAVLGGVQGREAGVVGGELDAYYARLYGLTRDELRYILDPADVLGEGYPSETFRVLKNKELREFGEYRTQRLVLAAWDAMAAHAVSPPFPAQSPA